MSTQTEKGDAFRKLHARKDAFIIPNPWDAGTARMLAYLGFEALATTSAGYAFSVGQLDGSIGRERMLVHVAQIAASTPLPVSADLENGYGDDPESVAVTVKQAGDAGAVGCSIEDATGRPQCPLYELAHAVDRIRAASEAARSLPFAFTLTARAENYLVGKPDIKDTIKRLQAYQEAGADVLYAPGLSSRDDIAELLGAVERPVNVLVGFSGMRLALGDLSDLGVKRISTGSTLTRTALGAFVRAAREMREHGSFAFSSEVMSSQDIIRMFKA
ncbi:MAG: isocitrate lyase/phosphoenolpyruvate mutase family protein [Gammaproteobacteria bacterium]